MKVAIITGAFKADVSKRAETLFLWQLNLSFQIKK